MTRRYPVAGYGYLSSDLHQSTDTRTSQAPVRRSSRQACPPPGCEPKPNQSRTSPAANPIPALQNQPLPSRIGFVLPSPEGVAISRLVVPPPRSPKATPKDSPPLPPPGNSLSRTSFPLSRFVPLSVPPRTPFLAAAYLQTPPFFPPCLSHFATKPVDSTSLHPFLSRSQAGTPAICPSSALPEKARPFLSSTCTNHPPNSLDSTCHTEGRERIPGITPEASPHLRSASNWASEWVFERGRGRRQPHGCRRGLGVRYVTSCDSRCRRQAMLERS